MNNNDVTKLISELKELDHEPVVVDGKLLKPSQCFRYGTDPLHFMFNTNCPDELKITVQEIFEKFKFQNIQDGTGKTAK